MHRRPVSTRRAATVAVGTVFLLSGVAGCSTHDVAVSRPCPEVIEKKAAAISNRGAIAMAKIGLTPESLKAREDCS